MIRAICVARMPPYRQGEIDCLHFVTEICMTDRETGTLLDPKWDANGLITGVVTDAATGALLMVAHLNAEALALTQSTGEAHFWSRSRGRLWKKGEESGNVLRVVELRIDCDQDALWIKAEPAGPACHTGAASCFYRTIEGVVLNHL
jgi:phosphoribosyl-AMP cyclohydrolase